MRILHLAQRGTSLHVLLIVVMTMLLAACGNTTPAEQIVGKWKLTEFTSQGKTLSADDFGYERVYQFFEDGSMASTKRDPNSDQQSIDRGTYILLANGQLTRTIDERPSTRNAEFKGNILILTARITPKYDPSSRKTPPPYDIVEILERID